MADFKFYDNLETLDENDDDTSSFAYSGRDSVLIAVDCCDEMFRTAEGEKSPPFTKICKSIKDLLRNKIICSERDLQGVVFFGTEQSENLNDFKHIFEVQRLDSPSASRIEELQVLEDSSYDQIKEKYGQSKDHLISELLWCCSSIFSQSTLKLLSKTVLIFTWDDDPHQDDGNAQLRARTKARDLIEQDVNVQVLSFNPTFSYEKFYKDIISDSDTDVALVQNPIDGIQNLSELLLRKSSKQRNLASVHFRLFDGMELAVGLYSVARRAVKGRTVNIDSRYNKEVQLKRNLVDKDTAEVLMPGDIKYSQKWGGRDIAFDADEVQDMGRFHGTGMKLLGFKPKDKAIKTHYHVRPSQFIYPSEKSIKGSTTLFLALLTKCIAKNVVPICSLSPRANSAPKLVALLPQPEVMDETTGEQMQSPGFYVVYLPSSEDLRKFDHKVSKEPNQDAVEIAAKMIRKLRFNFHPSSFDNPALQTYYRSLEAMALDKDEAEDVVDRTLPDCANISGKVGDIVTEFKSKVFPPDYDLSKKAAKGRSSAATKRKAGEANGAPATKLMSGTDIRDLVQSGKLAKLTVPALKDICKKHGIVAAGKKRDLMDAIEQTFK